MADDDTSSRLMARLRSGEDAAPPRSGTAWAGHGQEHREEHRGRRSGTPVGGGVGRLRRRAAVAVGSEYPVFRRGCLA